MAVSMIRYPKNRKTEKCTGCGGDMYYPVSIINLEGEKQERLCNECTIKVFMKIFPEVMDDAIMENNRIPRC